MTTPNYNDLPFSAFTEGSSISTELIKQFCIGKTARVLDLGCGIGKNLLAASRAIPNAEFIGVDISTINVTQAKKNASDNQLQNISFYIGDYLEYVEKRDIDHDSIIKLMEGQILEGLGNDEPTQNSIFGAMMKVHMNHESAHSDAFDIDQNEKANPVTTDHHESAHSVATDRCPSCGYTETPEGELCQLCEFDKKNP